MQHHAQTGAIAAAAATLVASLPDPRQPTIILFFAGLGALVGTAVGRLRQLPREQIREMAEDSGFGGGVIGAITYLTAIVQVLDETERGQLLVVILTTAVACWMVRTWWR